MSRPTSTRPPVDEDVDDLDDLLEQFEPAQPKKAEKAATPAPAPAAAAPSSSAASQGTGNAGPGGSASKPPIGLDDLDLNEDFARELAEGMASLMREIAVEAGSGPDKGDEKDAPQTEDEQKREEAFRKAWEAMIVQALDGEADEGAGAGAGAGASASASASEKGKSKASEGASAGEKSKSKASEAASTSAGESAKKKEAAGKAQGQVGEDKFQSSIKKAMEKLKESESSLHAADSTDDEDALEQLLKGFGEGGGNPEDQLQGLLENMMTQLMSKDVLYEPLKELHEKFPGFMQEKGATLKPEDKKRFEGQQVAVQQIVTIFEDPSYSTENVEANVKIVTLMNEMQSYGSPPTEIMGPLPPGLEVGQDGLPSLPDGCTIA